MKMKKYKLRELLTIKNGKDHKQLKEGVYPVLGSGGVMRYVDTFLYDKPSVLLPRKGSLNNIQYSDKPFWTVDTLYYTEVNEKKVNAYYLYNYLKLLDLSNLDSGTGVPSMTFDSYYNLSVNLPSLEIQNKVASALFHIDEKISINRQINRNLEELAKQIYDYWFLQFDFPNEDGKPYKSSGGKMVWNDVLKRDIPAGWNCFEMQNICNISRGASPRPIEAYMDTTNTGIPWIKISDATEDIESPYLLKIKDCIIPEGKEKSVSVKPDTLIVSNSATPGIPKFVELNACVHDGWLILDKYDSYYKYYLFYVIKMVRYNLLYLASGSIFKNLKTDYLKTLPTLVPDIKILQRFDEKIERIMKHILKTEREINELIELRDNILPLLMNGQVTLNSCLSAHGILFFVKFTIWEVKEYVTWMLKCRYYKVFNHNFVNLWTMNR